MTSLEQGLAREVARLVRQLAGQALRQALEQADAAPDPLIVAAAPQASGPAALAAVHPGGGKARQQAQQLYGRCLAHYRSQVQRRLLPAGHDDDVGLAAAYFVLANLAAVEQREPDPARLPVLERQLRHLLSITQAWREASLADRQSLFEQLALLGVLVNESRLAATTQGEGARQNLERAARGYLLQLLGLDADELVMTPLGLATADAVH